MSNPEEHRREILATKGKVKGYDFSKFHPNCGPCTPISNGAGWIYLLCLECKVAAELESTSEKLLYGAEGSHDEGAHK